MELEPMTFAKDLKKYRDGCIHVFVLLKDNSSKAISFLELFSCRCELPKLSRVIVVVSCCTINTSLKRSVPWRNIKKAKRRRLKKSMFFTYANWANGIREKRFVSETRQLQQNVLLRHLCRNFSHFCGKYSKDFEKIHVQYMRRSIGPSTVFSNFRQGPVSEHLSTPL